MQCFRKSFSLCQCSRVYLLFSFPALLSAGILLANDHISPQHLNRINALTQHIHMYIHLFSLKNPKISSKQCPKRQIFPSNPYSEFLNKLEYSAMIQDTGYTAIMRNVSPSPSVGNRPISISEECSRSGRRR